MLPCEIELILYAAPLVTQQANLMPLFMRIIFFHFFSVFVSCFFLVLNILPYTKFNSIKFKFRNDSIIGSPNTWALQRASLISKDTCRVALVAVLLFRAKEYICLGLAVITGERLSGETDCSASIPLNKNRYNLYFCVSSAVKL